MGKRGFGSKRRTVVQLEDGPRKQPTYGLGYTAPPEEIAKTEGNANALSGLMSLYAQDSDSGGESGDEEFAAPVHVAETKPGKSSAHWQQFVAATDTAPPPPPPDNPSSTSAAVAHRSSKSNATTASSEHKKLPATTAGNSVSKTDSKSSQNAPVDEIDMKLQDFLAEIESIEVPTETNGEDIDGIPIANGDGKPEKRGHVEMPVEGTSSVVDSVDGTGSEEEEEWNGTPPAEPLTQWQQCLDEETQCYYYWNYDNNVVTWEIPAEYSQYLLRYQEYELALARYEQELADWKKKATHRRHKVAKRKQKRVSKKPVEQLVIPLVTYPPASDDESETPPVPVYGPFLPPPSVTPPAPGPAERPPEPPPPREKPDGSSAVPDIPVIDNNSSKLQKKIDETGVERTADVKLPTEELSENASTPGKMEYDLEKLKALHEKFVRRSGRVQKEKEKLGEETAPKPPPLAEITAEIPLPAMEVEKMEEDMEETGRVVHEEPVFVRFEYVNRKYDETEKSGDGGVDAGGAGLDVDIDVDSELELALQQKQQSNRPAAGSSSAAHVAVGRATEKRKAADVDPTMEQFTAAKRLKPDEDEMLEASPRRSISENIRSKMNQLSEISDLSTTILDKLEFLEVTQAGLSKLQVLLLQIETRLEDWRAGALRTDHLVNKLRESCATLRQYELSATPPGWSCHWHRTYRRYFYSHDTTGATRWDYPESADAETDFSEQITTSDVSMSHAEIPPSRAEIPASYAEIPAESACIINSVPVTSVSCSSAVGADEVNADVEKPTENPPVIEPQQTVVIATTPSPSQMEIPAVATFPAEPLPPGTEPASLDLISLVSCPPPPPATPPHSTPFPMETETETDVRVDPESVPQSIGKDPENMTLETDHTAERDDGEIIDEVEIPGVISAPAVLNCKFDEIDTTSVASPMSDARSLSPARDVTSPVDGSLRSTATVEESGSAAGTLVSQSAAPVSSHGKDKEHRKKKDKSLVASGLSLKKKNVSSLVEKWQKVQQDVTDEVSKEEQKKLKKAAAAGLE